VKALVRGDYVLATKWSDGDPMDHFCVGLFREMLGDRFLVEDNSGQLFRRNGFRRCERIQRRTGDILVSAFPYIGDRRGHSLWYWRRHLKQLQELVNANRAICLNAG